MYTVTDNEGKSVTVEQDVFNELSQMRLDEFAILTLNNQPHIINIGENFTPDGKQIIDSKKNTAADS